jgi:hypothetical protein
MVAELEKYGWLSVERLVDKFKEKVTGSERDWWHSLETAKLERWVAKKIKK